MKFGPASIRCEVRASASVAWRGDRRLVTNTCEVRVVESLDTLAIANYNTSGSNNRGGQKNMGTSQNH